MYGPAVEPDDSEFTLTANASLGTDPTASHTRDPLSRNGWWDVPEWVIPDPSVDGRPGSTDVLGWSTGFNGAATRTQRFTGRTIVPPAPQPDPAIGPVGRDNRAGRLAAGVHAQSTDFLPDMQSIARAFTTGRGPGAFSRRVMGGE